MTLPATIDRDYVRERLEQATQTLAMLPAGGTTQTLRVQTYGYQPEPDPKAVATHQSRGAANARDIAAMEEALNWISWIGNMATRRIVGMRSLQRGQSGKALHSWRQIGDKIGAAHEACRRWHGQGLDEIVRWLEVGRRN